MVYNKAQNRDLDGLKALFVELNEPRLKDIEKPSPKKGEILVRMHCCGVCGTDIEKVKGQALTPPVLGHEVVGEVAEVGKGVYNIRVGDRVFVHHHAPCYTCDLCKKGEYTLCSEFQRHNIWPGGFSEYFIVPEWNVSKGAVLRLPDNVSYEDGSFIEPLGCCLRALIKARVEDCSSAIIYGAGPVGLLHLKLLRIYGFNKVVVADPSRYRAEFAVKLGADSAFDPNNKEERENALSHFKGIGPELAIVATSSQSAIIDAIKTITPGGKVILFGAPFRGTTLPIRMDEYFIKGVTMLSSYSTSEKETSLALQLIGEKRINVSELITHRLKLEDAPFAFKLATEQECIKAVIVN